MSSAELTGVIGCYLGTAYALYLLDHNVELQSRLINRLKDRGNFQGAYYELIVASVLIRAGFKLTLEDETDRASKHCEFAAVSPTSSKRYWVEAKMRSVNGLLGRTAADGGHDNDPLSRLVPHLNAALRKPASDERLIFIDVNSPYVVGLDSKPDWLETAIDRLDRFEREKCESGETAYVFVTNIAFHRHLDAAPLMFACPFGLGMPDFNRPGTIRVSEAYRQKQKHIDAHLIGKSFERYLVFPITFDGRLPSEAFGHPTSRVKIGETYYFADVGDRGIVSTVTSATVLEIRKEATIVVADPGGVHHVLCVPMSDADLAEYRQVPESYFGRVEPPPSRPKNALELFEWLRSVYKGTSRAKLLEWMSGAGSAPMLNQLSDDEFS